MEKTDEYLLRLRELIEESDREYEAELSRQTEMTKILEETLNKSKQNQPEVDAA